MPDSVKEPLLETLFSGFIGQGEKVDEFENEFSKKFRIPNVVSLNSGTSALRLALVLAGVGPGDEVISTPYTMVATNTAILEQFAKPVFTDIEYDSINMNPADIEHRITERTRAIMCVHWGGYPCDMDEIHKIASYYKIPVIEDAAHALGANYKGRPIGTLSDYTVFSFQAIKHLTTIDGGMLSINRKEKYDEAIRRRWFGIDRANRSNNLNEDPFGDIKELGYKYHMNDVAATIGLEQLKYFDMTFKRRSEIADIYRKGLGDINGIKLLEKKSDRINANWMFAVHVENRKGFLEHMKSKGIGAVVHNWRNDNYTIFGGLRKELSSLERVNRTLVNLPIHHNISDKEMNYILNEINFFCRNDND
jgi:perosamine synthetase